MSKSAKALASYSIHVTSQPPFCQNFCGKCVTDPSPSKSVRSDDTGFGPKVNNSLTYLHSENICLTRRLWKHCQIFHIALFTHRHSPRSTTLKITFAFLMRPLKEQTCRRLWRIRLDLFLSKKYTPWKTNWHDLLELTISMSRSSALHS